MHLSKKIYFIEYARHSATMSTPTLNARMSNPAKMEIKIWIFIIFSFALSGHLYFSIDNISSLKTICKYFLNIFL